MRTFMLLFCTTVFSFSANEVFSQNDKIVINDDKDYTIDEIFDLFREQTKHTFIYQEDLFKKIPKLHLEKGTIKANELLEKSFSSDKYSFSFTRKNRIIIIEEIPVTIKEEINIQKLQVSGIVTDIDGNPLPGASIVEFGTDNGTSSDFDGNYEINLPDGEQTLVFSYLGFKTQEVEINGRSKINVVLEIDSEGLDEIVITGYGEVRRKDLTGSVAKVNGDDLANLPAARVDQSLQGRASGVQVSSISGEPGAATTIRIRGGNSIQGNNEPLWVIDGIIVGTDYNLSNINANDIKSIDVLKDAVAVLRTDCFR